ncbi:LysR family transcriptional regulator [Azospirillum sp. RWY-5-1]|uniref:LysR family transcriptional regulator n=1 Tax=Azospirillum oleiclasticum TaxID=2735135 RepID=A0ABX2T6S5_9PROT|nr:LysR family transcriptional regulator [Azospirillum oleiclasticum]NYZ12731.1 LysR family transcriptional regulator [Azospirillum oleiclasticum]NYZ19891.1 LysR family transcriptional regulator [Azospirillum oleiclasticum]
MDDLDLRDLSAFAAVARHRNFRRAALEQRVSVSTLSERVRALEERLGLRLLNRTTRSVAPTEAGQRLLDRLAPALREVVEAVAQVRGAADDPSGRLRINAPPPAAQLVLAPLVAGFLERFPRVTLEVVTDSALIDIVAEGFDAGVRYEEHLAQDMIAVPLGPPERYVIVASPALLAAHGVPRTPEDLRDRPCLTTRFRSGRQLPWEFEKDGQTLRIQPEARLSSTLTALLIQAAIDGAGFFLAFEGHVRDVVADGRLVTVLDDWCPPFPGPFLYYPSRRQPPPALAAFVAYVAERRRSAGW